MKKISSWAKAHKWPARFIIIAAFIILNGLGIATGVLFSQLNVSVPAELMFIFFCALLVGVAAYPSKDQKGKKLSRAAFYVKQKSCDFMLAASSFCMVVYLGNHPDRLFQHYPSLNAAVKSESSFPKDSALKSYKSISVFSGLMKDENGKTLKWKERKKLLREQVKNIQKANDVSKGGKILLVILSVLVAIGLLAVVAALSCNISCGGSGALAVIVAIGGTALVIYLLVRVIRSIYGKKKKQTDEKTG